MGKSIEIINLENRLEQLNRLIDEAEYEGNYDRADELIQEFNWVRSRMEDKGWI